MSARCLAALGLASLWLLTAAALCGCSRAPRPPLAGKNLLLISVDTLRPDYLSPYGRTIETPTFQRLADEGVTFEQAVSPVPLTQPAHTSLLTGQYPGRHGVRDNADFTLSDRAQSLFERLKDAGYQTGAVVAASVLARRTGLDQGFDHYDDQFTSEQIGGSVPVVERVGTEITQRALKWLAGRERNRPFALFAHYYDPHFPYAAPGELGTQYAGEPYTGEVVFTDRCLKDLLAGLEREDLLEQTLVLLVSDHGECLGEHGEATHGLFLYDAAVRVPFLLRLPGTGAPRGLRVPTPVSLVDVVPTLLELLGLPPLTVDGVSLVPLLSGGSIAARELYGETLYPLFYRWSPSFSLRRAGHKFILSPKQELYDLAADPRELDNLFERQGERARGFEAAMLAQIERWNRADRTAEKSQELASARALAALGYTGGSAIDAGAAGALPDMKDRVALYEELSAALLLMTQQKWHQARRRLEQVLAQEPQNPSALLNLGDVMARLGQFEAAQKHFLACLEQSPENRMARASLGMLYFFHGKLEEAQAQFETLLERAPKSAEPLFFLGQVHERRGRWSQALECYRRVQELMPGAPGLPQRIQEVERRLQGR
jgi:arylsulfatase A-like enzyme